MLLANNGLFLAPKKAQAAELSMPDINVARQAVHDIKPIINPTEKNDIQPMALTPDGFLPKPLITETEVTKNPIVAKKVAVKTTVAKTASISQVSVEGASAHSFPYGYCTSYVASQRFIPWSGNAISWLSGAISYGFATGAIPQVGAIIVTSEGGSAGHVGMVDAVNGDQITITEMNYRGFGVISTRTISSSYGRIMGYIY